MHKDVSGLGELGINLDMHPWQLPLNAWQTCRNARCQDGQIGAIEGYVKYFDVDNDLPMWLLPVTDQELYFWLVAGLTSVRAWDGTSLIDITDTPFNGLEQNRWSGGALGTVPILTNGVDAPRFWSPIASQQDLQILPYDDTDDWETKGYRARVMRPFRDVMVAMGIEDQDGSHPLMVHWSDPADPGSTPRTWDFTLPNNLSGRAELATSIGARTSGRIVDGHHIGNRFFIYKTDSVWTLDWVGGQFVMSTKPVAGLRGMIAQGCVVEVEGSHIVLGDEDLYAHNGNRPQSLINKRVQRDFFRQINPDEYWRSYLVKNRARNEVWACIPTANATWPDLALVWNFRHNTLTFRDLPGCSHIERGVVVRATQDQERWDSTPDPQWQNWDGTWGEALFSPINDFPVGVSPDAGGTQQVELIQDNGFDDPGYWTIVPGDPLTGSAEVSFSEGAFFPEYQAGANYSEITRAGVFTNGQTYDVTIDLSYIFPSQVVFRMYNGTQQIMELASDVIAFNTSFIADQDGDLRMVAEFVSSTDTDGEVYIDNLFIKTGAPASSQAWIFDQTFSLNGANQPVMIERTGIEWPSPMRFNETAHIYLYGTGTALLDVYVGGQEEPGGTVTWSDPYPFQLGVDQKVDAQVTGYLHALRIESDSTDDWMVSAYRVEYEPAGER